MNVVIFEIKLPESIFQLLFDDQILVAIVGVFNSESGLRVTDDFFDMSSPVL